MRREIKTYPDPVLRQENREVATIDDALRDLARDMTETMYAHNGIGLAAPQVGENVALITLDVSGAESRNNLIVLFNPRIESQEGEREGEEGCLSVPEFSCTVTRSEKVRVQGLSLEGEPVSLDAEGLLAVCLQHEIDHLQGRLILDHAGRLKRSMYDKKISKWQKRSA